MNGSDVRIVELESLRVASALGFGAIPELEAWEKVLSWAGSKNLLEDLSQLRFFGFNNPDPSAGSPNYGYEQWMTITADIEGDDEIKVKEFPGGLYAVKSCQGIETIYPSWQSLVVWCEESSCDFGSGQALEELLNPELFIHPDGTFESPENAAEELRFDLYLSIVVG